MSFFGKILVVLQLVLSILFMMFAAAVYTTHTNWRDEANKQKTLANKLNVEKNNLTEEYTKRENALTEERNSAVQKAQLAEAELQLAQQKVETSKAQNAQLQTALATAQRRAQNAAEEASARNDEARNLREVNHEQTGLIGEAETMQTELEDTIRRLEVEVATANQKNRGLLERISQFTALLAKNGISADEAIDVASVTQPPPRIEGKVETVRRPAKLGNSELLKVSLGSNDGLKKGHEMTVWRSGAQSGGKPRYLARIRIVNTEPDVAVGEVIENTRNGEIQEGDNVSTKL